MNYAQVVSPNLSTVGNIGWCLSFVEDVFNTPHSYATATDAWNAVRRPHLDRNLPNVSVPVWYSYFEGGVNYGHVAVWVPGRGVLSSPYKQNGTSQWFASIDECGRVLRCTYLGWSEDLAGVQLIKEKDMFEKGDAENIVPALTGRSIDAGGYGYVGQDFHDAIYGILASPSFKNYVGQIPQLQDALAKANEALVKAQQQPVAVPQATLDQINQTSQDVSWIRALLNKIFK